MRDGYDTDYPYQNGPDDGSYLETNQMDPVYVAPNERQTTRRTSSTRGSSRSSGATQARSGGSSDAIGKVKDVAKNIGGSIAGAFGGVVSKVKDAVSNKGGEADPASTRTTRRRPANLDPNAEGSDGLSERAEARARQTGPSEDYLGTGEPCARCGHPVDSHQARCPHCGAFVTPLYKNPYFLVPVIALAVASIALAVGVASCKGPGAEPTTQEGQVATEQQPEESGAQDEQGGATEEVATDARSTLTTAVASAQSAIDSNAGTHTYTNASIANLVNVLGQSRVVLENPEASDEEITNATGTLTAAMQSLIQRPSAEGYTLVYYGDLTASLDSYVGQLLSSDGSISSMIANPDGSTTMTVEFGGVDGLPMSVTFNDLTNVSGDLYVDTYIAFGGTLMGTVDYIAGDGSVIAIPAYFADYIDIY